jgi:phosphoenolpyruvate carboxylase
VLEQSFIGSRPTRRTGRRTIEDLRAIPWVFSWLQSRYYLPAWYGLGSALERLEREDAEGFAFLKESAQAWPFMRYVLFNAETSLASADLELMRAYADLVEDASIRERVFNEIAAEFARTETQINNVFGAPRNVRRPRMQATLALRESGLRVLHLRQIALLREWRTLRKAGGDEAAARLLPSLLLSINAIASGERTTG